MAITIPRLPENGFPARALHWLTASRSVIWLLAAPALAIGLISIIIGYFGHVLPSIDHFHALDFREQLETKRPSEIVGDFIWNRSVFLFILLVPAFVAALLQLRKVPLPLGIVVLFFGLVTSAALGAEITKNWEGGTVSLIGEEPSVNAYKFKLFLIVFALMSPASIYAFYCASSTMDRYTMRNLGAPLILCLLGFIAIALLIDLTDNFADFSKSKSSMAVIFFYYVTLLPQIIVLFTPIALLLALLFTLSKMSRANEIISMLGTGRSTLSILRPVFFIGFMASMFCMALNYYWAPRSVGATEAIIDAINQGVEPDSRATRQLYVNQTDRRTWYVGRIPFDLNPNSSTEKMKGIEIYGEDKNGKLIKAWLAKSARWWPPSDTGEGGGWTLYNGFEIEYDEEIATKINRYDGDGTEGNTDRLDLNWKETPWQIISLTLRADFLSVPELGSYIRANATPLNTLEMAPFRTYWHYDLALPWSCFVVVLIAAPLGIVYSRRGVLAGVAAAIIIFFGIMVVDSIFLKMGKFNTISPIYAAWMPRIIFGGVGLIILLFRARNREIPKLNPFLWIRNYRAAHAS